MQALHHVEIYVRDLRRTREFYDFLMPELGYRVYQEWDEGVSYLCGDCYIVFVQTLENHLDTEYNRCNVGLNHLAFRAESPEAVDRMREMLIARGAALLYDERYPYAGGEGYYAVYFEDPDRIKLEITADQIDEG